MVVWKRDTKLWSRVSPDYRNMGEVLPISSNNLVLLSKWYFSFCLDCWLWAGQQGWFYQPFCSWIVSCTLIVETQVLHTVAEPSVSLVFFIPFLNRAESLGPVAGCCNGYLTILDVTQNSISRKRALRGGWGFQCAHMCLYLCACWLYCSPKQGDKNGIIPYLPATSFSDLSLKHLVLASIRDRILTLVSQQVWQFPYFQALNRNRLFSSRGWLVFLANADSQMPLSHSLLILIHNLRWKVKG